MSKRAIVLLAGELPSLPDDLTVHDDDLIICADGGFANALHFGIKPHLLLGDMDSIDTQRLGCARAQGIEIVTYPAEKDMTDSDLALETAFSRGCREAVMLGALGGSRLDHGIANVMLLARWRERGLKVLLLHAHNCAQVISDEAIMVHGAQGDYVSLIPLAPEVTGVTTSGLKYPLHEATLRLGSTWGLSNELLGTQAAVRCTSGVLLVTVCHK